LHPAGIFHGLIILAVLWAGVTVNTAQLQYIVCILAGYYFGKTIVEVAILIYISKPKQKTFKHSAETASTLLTILSY